MLYSKCVYEVRKETSPKNEQFFVEYGGNLNSLPIASKLHIGSSLLWTHTLRPLYSRPIALTQEGRSLVNDVCECVRD